MKKIILIATITGGILFGQGCASKPEDIAPAYTSEMSYRDWSCRELGEEQLRLHRALSTASDAQRTARSNDIAGVILIGLPVSSLSGSNQAANISRLKGELEAIQKVGIKKDCGLPSLPDPTTEVEKKDEKSTSPVH